MKVSEGLSLREEFHLLSQYLPPARFWSLVEAAVAAVLVIVGASGETVAAILAVVAIATGEQVRRKVAS